MDSGATTASQAGSSRVFFHSWKGHIVTQPDPKNTAVFPYLVFKAGNPASMHPLALLSLEFSVVGELGLIWSGKEAR